MSLVVRIALLRRRPQRWGPRLAEALVTRSHQMSGLPGGTARRAAAAQEAVALCRRLAADRPDRHRVDLARALVARVSVPDAQPMVEAIDQLREAIGYVEDPPDRPALVVLAAARGGLAGNLRARGGVPSGAGPDTALRAAGEAVGRRRKQVPARPGELAAALRVHGQLLLRSLRNLAGALAGRGRADEAGTLTAEAETLAPE
jgi:hypothetical protein